MKHQRICSIVAALLLTPGVSLEAQNNGILTNGLVAFFPFNGNVNDESGHGNNGIVSNVAFVQDRFGKTNSSGYFAGNSSSYVQIPSTQLNLPPDFTVSVWFKFTAGSGTDNPRIFSTAGYEVGTQTTANNRLGYFDNTTLSAGAPTVNSSNTVPAGVWTHLVGVRAGSTLLLFINGNPAGSVTTTQPPDYSRNFTPEIGGNSGNGSDAFGGAIDDLRIFNRALSAQEVSELFVAEGLNLGIVTLPTITIRAYQEITNKTYRIEYKDEATATEWTNLVTNIVLTNDLYVYPDISSLNRAKRFYRVVSE